MHSYTCARRLQAAATARADTDRFPQGVNRCSKRWCTALAGSYFNKRKAAEMRLFSSTKVSHL